MRRCSTVQMQSSSLGRKDSLVTLAKRKHSTVMQPIETPVTQTPEKNRRRSSVSVPDFVKSRKFSVSGVSVARKHSGLETIDDKTDDNVIKSSIFCEVDVDKIIKEGKHISVFYLDELLDVFSKKTENAVIVTSRSDPKPVCMKTERQRGVKHDPDVEDTIDKVLATIKENSQNVDTQTDCCRRLRLFANNDALDVIMGREAAVTSLMAALKQHPRESLLAKEALLTLIEMSNFTEAASVHVGRNDGISLLLQLLAIYRENMEVLELVLELLANISSQDDLAFDMAQRCIHSELLSIMSRDTTNSVVASACCFILGNISASDIEVTRSIMFVGGVHTILGVMVRFQHEPTVTEDGCRAIGCFAAHDEMCVDIAHAGAIGNLVTAIMTFPEEEALLECACWALTCLTKFEEPCCIFCSKNGIEHLLTVLKRHKHHVTIIEYGCWCLCNIANHDSVCNHLDDKEVFEILLKCMETLHEQTEILDHLLFTVSIVVTLSEARQLQLVGEGGVQHVINAMSFYQDHVLLQENGCRILGNLCVNGACRREVEAFESSRYVIKAMLNNNGEEDLLLCGCMALINITADNVDNKRTAVTNGAVLAILRIFQEFPDNNQIKLFGLKALVNVIEIDDACYDLVEHGGLQDLDLIVNSDPSDDLCRLLWIVYSYLPKCTDIKSKVLEGLDDFLQRQWIKRGNSDEMLFTCIFQFYEHLVVTVAGYELFIYRDWQRNLRNAMMTSQHNKLAVICSCNCLLRLIKHDNPRFNPVPCLDILMDTVHKQLQNPDVLVSILNFVAHITDNPLLINSDEILCKVVKSVCLCLHHYGSDVTVQMVGLLTLEGIIRQVAFDLEEKEINSILTVVNRAFDTCCDSDETLTFCSEIFAVVYKDANPGEEFLHKSLRCVTSILQRQRINQELRRAATKALQSILYYANDRKLVEICKQELPFLPEEVWLETYTDALEIH